MDHCCPLQQRVTGDRLVHCGAAGGGSKSAGGGCSCMTAMCSAAGWAEWRKRCGGHRPACAADYHVKTRCSASACCGRCCHAAGDGAVPATGQHRVHATVHHALEATGMHTDGALLSSSRLGAVQSLCAAAVGQAVHVCVGLAVSQLQDYAKQLVPAANSTPSLWQLQCSAGNSRILNCTAASSIITVAAAAAAAAAPPQPLPQPSMLVGMLTASCRAKCWFATALPPGCWAA